MSTSINPSGGGGGDWYPSGGRGEGLVLTAPLPGGGGLIPTTTKTYNMRVYYTHTQAMNIQTHIHTRELIHMSI